MATILSDCVWLIATCAPAYSITNMDRYCLWIANILLVRILSLLLYAPHLAWPSILIKNSRTVIIYSAIPYCVSVLVPCNAFAIVRDILCINMLVTCMQKVIHIHSLYTSQTTISSSFFQHFPDIVHRLSHIVSHTELESVIKLFFKKRFHITPAASTLYHRPPKYSEDTTSYTKFFDLESWLQRSPYAFLTTYLATHPVILRDFVTLSLFCKGNETEHERGLLQLLDHMDADGIILLYEHTSVLGFILIQRPVQSNPFTPTDHEELRILTAHLNSVVQFLHYKNIITVLKQEHTRRATLHQKEQELSHHRESIDQLLIAVNGPRTIGFILYQGEKFIQIDETAQELFYTHRSTPSDLIPYASELKCMAQESLRYRTQRQMLITVHNQDLRCMIIPCHDTLQVIILVYPPNSPKLPTIPFDTLKNSALWDYALYLETTQSGKLIDKLALSAGAVPLDVKIALLQTALGTHATLLDVPEIDYLPIVTTLHHISKRTNLHLLKITQQEQDNECGVQLFGHEANHEKDGCQGLLALLGTGTLFIQGIELLSLETQQALAFCLTTGKYKLYHGNTWNFCNARILCTTRSSPTLLMEQGVLSQELFSALCIISHRAPSDVLQQAKKRRNRVHISRNSQHEALQLSEYPPEIEEAIQLGSKALKSRRLMSLLWTTFHSPEQIAALLKVSVTLVARRCKELNEVDQALS